MTDDSSYDQPQNIHRQDSENVDENTGEITETETVTDPPKKEKKKIDLL